MQTGKEREKKESIINVCDFNISILYVKDPDLLFITPGHIRGF